ncbi:MAG: SpoIIE family protein phosphatase [Candidatus Krumholzibacteriota bacterium]|nr:SpoIIE family protein phosphatase [Candidatus Krumholzibacteriota bacterium]
MKAKGSENAVSRTGFVDSDSEAVRLRKILSPAARALLDLKERALESTAEGIVIADASRPNNPIIYANRGFERLTGFPVEFALGKNCRFLQGPATDRTTAQAIKQALVEQRPCRVEILNYRKDRTPFWNGLSITPVRDAAGRVTHYIGIQSDVTKRRQAEDALQEANHRLEMANRTMKRDLAAAARIQQALLPSSAPQIPGLRCAWTLKPCEELAGDALNIIRLDEERVAVYVLDVSGHGVPAALLSVTLNRWLTPTSGPSPLRTVDGDAVAPARIAERLNRQFPLDPRTAQYFTILYGILDVRARTFRYVAAGHPAPLLLRRGQAPRALTAANFPVGVVPEPRFDEDRVALEPGDRLYLYTDGLPEAENSGEAPFGTERMLEILGACREQRLEASVERLVGAAEIWREGARQDDDISLLALELA